MLDGVNNTPSLYMSETSGHDGLSTAQRESRDNNVEEADHSHENEEMVFKEHGDMVKESYAKKDDVNMLLKPVSPLVASATVVNLLLATGPFS